MSESSEGGLDSDGSKGAVISRKASRLASKNVVYSEADSQESEDETENAKKRLREVLSSDSGSDKDYVVPKKLTKPAQPLKKKRSTSLHNRNSAQPRPKKSRNRTLSENSKLSTNTKGGAVTDIEESSSSLSSDVSSINDSLSEKSGSSWRTYNSSHSVPAQTRLSQKSTGRILKDIDEEKLRNRRASVDLSYVFRTPSLLKFVEGSPRNTLIKCKRRVRERDPLHMAVRWKRWWAQLQENIRLLRGSGDRNSARNLIFVTLNSKAQLFGFYYSWRHGSWIESKVVTELLCIMAMQLIVWDTPDNSFSNVCSRTDQLHMLGEELVGLYHNEVSLRHCVLQLMQNGSIKQAYDIANAYKPKTRSVKGSSSQDVKRIKLLKAVLEMMVNKLDDGGQMMGLANSITTEVRAMMGEDVKLTEKVLPVILTYISHHQDVDSAIEVLETFRKENPKLLGCHETLVNFLREQQCDHELTQALDEASQRFPHLDFALQYAQAVVNKDDSLDESFDSQDDGGDAEEEREKHIKICSKLVRHLDNRLNCGDQNAWNILVNSALKLAQAQGGTSQLIPLFKYRLRWWFAQNKRGKYADTGLLSRKLIFYSLLLGVQDTHTQELRLELQERLESGDENAKAHLAEADAYSNKHPNPLLEQLQQAKPGDVSEEDDKSDSNESDSNESDSNESGTNSEREEEGSEIDEDNYSESEAGTIDAIDNESDIEIDDSPVKSKEKKDKTEKNVDLEELMQHNWKIIEDRRKEAAVDREREKWEASVMPAHQPVIVITRNVSSRSHVRGLRYFKNLLYMHRETRLELLASAVPDLVKESENSKYRKRDHYPDIVLYPTRFIPEVTRILQRNNTEEKLLYSIIKDEGYADLSRSHFKAINTFMEWIIRRIVRYVDWSEVNTILELAHDEVIGDKEDIKDFVIFHKRFVYLMRNKLNPLLALEISVNEYRGVREFKPILLQYQTFILDRI